MTYGTGTPTFSILDMGKLRHRLFLSLGWIIMLGSVELGLEPKLHRARTWALNPHQGRAIECITLFEMHLDPHASGPSSMKPFYLGSMPGPELGTRDG